jgi:hypothetical protein
MRATCEGVQVIFYDVVREQSAADFIRMLSRLGASLAKLLYRPDNVTEGLRKVVLGFHLDAGSGKADLADIQQY